MQGKAFVFGDEINTDIITPLGADHSRTPAALVENLMSPVRPGFADELTDGDFIVAGEHFGSGSSRETAPFAIKEAGVAAVIAESFARIFYRNAVNIGLPALTCPGITANVTEGDTLAVDLDTSTLTNQTTGDTTTLEPIPPELQQIFETGGLLGYLNTQQ